MLRIVFGEEGKHLCFIEGVVPIRYAMRFLFLLDDGPLHRFGTYGLEFFFMVMKTRRWFINVQEIS